MFYECKCITAEHTYVEKLYSLFTRMRDVLRKQSLLSYLLITEFHTYFIYFRGEN